jgi:membrane protein
VNFRFSKIQKIGSLFYDAFNDWQKNNALRLSAALAYYSIFSIAPLLVLSVGLAGLFFGADAVRGELYGQLRSFLGPQASAAIQSMVQSTSHPAKSMLATVIGTVVLLFGAAGVFGQLKDALNTIWEVKTAAGLNWWLIVRERLLSFGMVLVIGFLLLISFVLTTLLSAFSKAVERDLHMPDWVLGGVGLIISFLIVTVLFAMIFKVLPDVTNRWKHVWIGAAATALLFEVGKFGLAYYLGRESTASSFGAAGSVVLLLLWVYYASCILLFGAEFTKMYALASGDRIRTEGLAVPETPASPAAGSPAPASPAAASLSAQYPDGATRAAAAANLRERLALARQRHAQSHPVAISGTAAGTLQNACPAGPGYWSAGLTHPLATVDVKTEGADGPMDYVREHMAVGILSAAGAGLAVGIASRFIPSSPTAQDPGSQFRNGLHLAGAASLLLLTRTGRAAASRLGQALKQTQNHVPAFAAALKR